MGIRDNILKNIDQNIVERNTYRRYLTEDLLDLIKKPSCSRNRKKIKELENKVTQNNILETKTKRLNNALFSVSIIVPGGLVITTCVFRGK